MAFSPPELDARAVRSSRNPEASDWFAPDQPSDFMPAQFALRRELLRKGAAEYEAFYQPEAVEARRQQHEAAARAELAAWRADLEQQIAAAKAALKASGPMTGEEFLAGEWE